MKLIAASTILSLAASQSLLTRIRSNEVLRNLLDINYVENDNGAVITTAYGDLTIQRNPPRATLQNGPNSISAYQDNGLFLDFDVADKTQMNSNFVDFLSQYNECPFETLDSTMALTRGKNSVSWSHQGSTDRGSFHAEATLALLKGKNVIRVNFNAESSGGNNVCNFNLNRKYSGFIKGTRKGENYRVQANFGDAMEANVAYTPNSIRFTASVGGVGYEQSVSAVDGSWATTTAIEYGDITIPGPGNLPAISNAIQNQFNWVIELAENGQEADALALVLHADKATALFADHFDVGPILDSINLDFPLSDDACENFDAVCGFGTFQEAVSSIGDVVNDRIVKGIQSLTSSVCPGVRNALYRALDSGVPSWWIKALA